MPNFIDTVESNEKIQQTYRSKNQLSYKDKNNTKQNHDRVVRAMSSGQIQPTQPYSVSKR